MLVAICQAHNASGPKALNDQSNDSQAHSNFMQNIVSRYLDKRSQPVGLQFEHPLVPQVVKGRVEALADQGLLPQHVCHSPLLSARVIQFSLE
jgi:hypothetical protein